MNNNHERINYSPENKKIIYYEENPKLFKKQRLRLSLDEYKLNNNENNMDNTNIRINFDDNIKFNQDLLEMNNNCCISQPSNDIQNHNFNGMNILDDLMNELEAEENENNMNYIKNKDNPMGSELNKLFERNKYTSFFQTSRTQNPQFPNIWDDFHQKRDKL